MAYTGNQWSVNGGKLYNKRTGEYIDIGVNWGTSFMSKPGEGGTAGMRSGDQQHVDRLVAFYLHNGRWATSVDDFNANKPSDVDKFGRGESAFENAHYDAQAFINGSAYTDFVAKETEYQQALQASNVGEGNDVEQNSLSPYYFNPALINQEGSKEKDIYDMFVSLSTKRNEAAAMKAAQDESNMQSELAGNRQKLLDDLRNRRRTMLKNGLSSAQIANEEVQSLLIGQNQAGMIAENYFNQRRDINAQAGMIPEQAGIDAMGLFNQLNQQGSAFNAGDAGSMAAAVRAYDIYKANNGGDTSSYDAMNPNNNN